MLPDKTGRNRHRNIVHGRSSAKLVYHLRLDLQNILLRGNGAMALIFLARVSLFAGESSLESLTPIPDL